MKLILTEIVICLAVALAAPADKSKRDILPGDPRYESEQSNSHFETEHDHEHVNEVQVLKSAGGYIGSYTVPDNTGDLFQIQPQSSYGPPSYTPGKPLGTDFFTSNEDLNKSPVSVLVPSTSYGIPDTQLLNNNFVSVTDDKKPTDIKLKKLVNISQTSYGAPGASEDSIIQEQAKTDTVEKIETQNEVHHQVQQPAAIDKHVETIPQTVSFPQVKVTATVPTKTQGVVQHSVPSFTSSISNFPAYSYSSFGNIPVKTVDHHVQVQIPHTYHVPVTKHVPVSVPVPHTVEVPKPYYVRVPQPVQVTVDRPYPVEVPHPVPYPVPHYVKTSVPVAHQHYVTVNAKDNPLQTFFDNTQSTFQNVVPQFPFSNPFENFDLSSFPSFIPSSFPSSISSSIPFLPQQSHTTSEVTTEHTKVPFSNSDSITIDNPILKPETTVTKTFVQPIITHQPKTVQRKQQIYKPSTACAGCTVTSSSNKQEYVQPVDANGGYVY